MHLMPFMIIIRVIPKSSMHLMHFLFLTLFQKDFNKLNVLYAFLKFQAVYALNGFNTSDFYAFYAQKPLYELNSFYSFYAYYP